MQNCQVNMFSRANILAQDSKISLVDSDYSSGLELFCYNSCSNNDDDFIKQCRGIVFHGEDLVLKAFSYTSEYDIDSCKNMITDFSKWSFYPSYEGALLRLFYFGDKWYLSTHRKLDAFRSKWSSKKSFGDLFKISLEKWASFNPNFCSSLQENEDIFEKFKSCLDKTKQYMFLLRNFKDNRIVCEPPLENEPHIFHVGTFVNHELDMSDQKIGLPMPEKHNFSSYKEICEYMKEMDPRYSQGLLCLGSDNLQIKILHKDYIEMFKVRGNEPSIKFRYLQIRTNEKLKQMLYYLYPEMRDDFNEYEKIINEIAVNIYRSYVQRFIKHYFITVPGEEYKVIKECHEWHLLDKLNNRINIDKVLNILNKQSPVALNHMIKRVKFENIIPVEKYM